ncbi:calcium-transporting ATPase 12, plasma membrane-type-like isoform X1 [Phaseolus vulgaris]|uniref:calcium-transporting ATPase 12, plasma membrane-type-like isoform X1 n=1 Tax=Phaseolus vulgaris TaxID=3885 RepID=UPI0035C96A20
MSQESTSSSGGDCGATIELGATLLGSTTKGKYTRIWRKSLYIRWFLISAKKPATSSGNHESPPSPDSLLPSIPFPSFSPARTSSSRSYVAVDIEEISSDAAGIVRDQALNSLPGLGEVDFGSTLLGGQLQYAQEHHDFEGGKTSIPLLDLFNSLLNSYKCYRCTILMLLVSAGLSFAIEFKQEGPKHGWHDGVAILFAILLLVLGKSVANFLCERKKLKLAGRKQELECRVKRGEEFKVVPISDIQVGEAVFLWPGDVVPADGELASDGILVLAELQEIKSKEQNPSLVTGSKVIGGQGWMLVTSVGTKTNLANIGICNSERRGLLERKIEKPISYIDMAALSVSVLVAFVVLVRLIYGKDRSNAGLPEMKGKVSIGILMKVLERIFLRPQGRVSILSGLVTVAILCVQHGMPLVVTISLKYQIDKELRNQDAVLNDLSACTTMGLVTVICIDVSGELISKQMEVSRISVGEEDIMSMVEGAEIEKLPVLDMLKVGVGVSVLAPEIYLSPLFNPLVSWAETTWEMSMRSFTEEKFDILKHSKLNSGGEGSGVLVRKDGDSEVLHLHWSGAASAILEMCSQYHDSEGNCHAMENQRIKFLQVIKDMEDNGLRPMAFAYKQTDGEELEQEELILSGVIGLKDTSQESIKPALESLRNAENVQIKLVSEDGIEKLEGIACELGLEHGVVLEGKQLQDLNEEARLVEVDRAHVMARFLPEDKLLMIQCLQEKGKVVAFIGTRLMNDHTSVLKVADVGIVLDSLSTRVDRESCDISIRCFSSLEPIVIAGRGKYLNIQKFIQLQLTCIISGSVITLLTTCAGDSPLAPFQLIWANVLVCILGGLMMVMTLTNQEQLSKQPSDHRNQNIMAKEIWKSIAIQVLYQTSVSMILEYGGHVTDWEKKVRETMIFNTFLLCQIVNVLNTMQLLRKEVLVQSFYFLGALVICFLMQVVVIEYAKGLADCMQLNATKWGICVMIGGLAWVFDWSMKNILPVLLNPNTNYSSLSIITSPSFFLSQTFSFVMLLLFPIGLFFSQIGMNMTLR